MLTDSKGKKKQKTTVNNIFNDLTPQKWRMF